MLMKSLVSLLMLLALLLSGCGGRNIGEAMEKNAADRKENHRFTRIKEGMTYEEVVAILGQPVKPPSWIRYNDPSKTDEMQAKWDNQYGQLDTTFVLNKLYRKFERLRRQ